MADRYLVVPKPFVNVNPVDGTPVMVPAAVQGAAPMPDVIHFSRSCRLALSLAMQEGKMDALDLIDLRKKTDTASAGTVLRLKDEEWQLLCNYFRKPKAELFGVSWAFAAEEHIRAVLGASLDPPAAPVIAPPNEPSAN